MSIMCSADPSDEEHRAIDEGINRAIAAITLTLSQGVDRAMNVYN